VIAICTRRPHGSDLSGQPAVQVGGVSAVRSVLAYGDASLAAIVRYNSLGLSVRLWFVAPRMAIPPLRRGAAHFCNLVAGHHEVAVGWTACPAQGVLVDVVVNPEAGAAHMPVNRCGVLSGRV